MKMLAFDATGLVLLFIPLIAFCVVVGLVAFPSFAILRKFFKNRRTEIILSSIGLGVVSFFGIIVWAMCFSPPLELPKGASDVKIQNASPLGWAIDSNLRFKIPPAEFRSWVEKLCHESWATIQANSGETHLVAFSNTKTAWSRDNFGTTSWMNTSAVRSGYVLTSKRAFYGTILYDTDSEVVYYAFWD